MTISDSVKANVRAVLLSKTDGKGVLVSTFLRDYKSIIGEQLLFKNMGYTTLENFIKEIPDVCRLEYSDKEMAYKLYGISKPNTYASSFMKRAEGGATDCEDNGSGRRRRNRSDKGDKVLPSTDINDDWLPNHRGHISLCFPNKPGNGIETKEDVEKLFSSFGEVAEINMIPQLTFVRFFNQDEAKKAVQTYGNKIGLRRADERKPDKDKAPRQDRNPRDSGDQKFRDNKKQNWESRDQRGARGDFNKENRREPNGFNKPQKFDNDEDWDDNPEPPSKPTHQPHSDKRQNRDTPQQQNSDFKQNRDSHQNRGPKPNRDMNQNRESKQMNDKKDESVLSAPRDNKEKIQVYVGNLPAEADSELEELVSPYKHIGVRIKHQDRNKTYAFVDFMDLSEAKRMIVDLNEVALNGRNLKIRFANQHLQDTMVVDGGGNAAAKASTRQPDQGAPSPKISNIEKQFEQMTVHRGNEYKQQHVSPVENLSRTVSNDYANRGSGGRTPGKKDSGRSSTASSSPQKMPALESVDGRNGYGDYDMPQLEEVQPRGRDQRNRGKGHTYKPQQQQARGQQELDMPPLEPSQLSLSPHMPTLETTTPRGQHGNQHRQTGSQHQGGYPGGYQSKSGGPQYEGGYPGGYQSKSGRSQYEGGYQSESQYEGGYQSKSAGPGYEGGYQSKSAGSQYEGGYQSMSEGPGGDAGYHGEIGGPQMQEPGEPVQLFLGNFPYGTRQEDLMILLGPFGVTQLTMMNQEVKNRSTYAFATCCDMAHAEHAIAELDQGFFRGRRLTLALANPVSHQAPSQAQSVSSSNTSLHMAGASPLANITCTVGGEAGRQVHLDDTFANPTDTSTPHNQQYNRDRPPHQNRNPNQPYNVGDNNNRGLPRNSKYGEGGLSVKTDFNYRRLTCLLKDYGMMVSKLRGEDRFEYQPGETLMVMITHVENDKVFWGQVVKDSVRGQNPDLQQLVSITVDLQDDSCKHLNIRNLGRCTARYNDEWFRAWCMHISNRDGHDMCDLLYVDYGNTEQVPKSEVFLTQTSKNVWTIPPIARPFKLMDHHFDLESLTNTLQVFEISEPGCGINNFVTTVIGKFEQ